LRAATWRQNRLYGLGDAGQGGRLRHGVEGNRGAAILNAQTPSALELIERAVARDAETYRNDAGELGIPMPCVMASALKA
jgi:hypothetical protein